MTTKIKNTFPSLSRTPMPSQQASLPSPTDYATPPPFPMPIPIIKLTTATPSVAGTPATHLGVSPLRPRPGGELKKRLVPKKSKLSLLVGKKEKGIDLSDVVRRVGANASTGRSFDIYVDPTDDPDIGEIVVVKKKKSRAALNGVWDSGMLGNVTNVPILPKNREKPLPSPSLDVKIEETKWWSIGRGKKEVKEKKKEEKKVAMKGMLFVVIVVCC